MMEKDCAPTDISSAEAMTDQEFWKLPYRKRNDFWNVKYQQFVTAFLEGTTFSDSVFAELSNRACNVIKNSNFTFLQMIGQTKRDFSKSVNKCGEKTAGEIEQWLLSLGYAFKEPVTIEEATRKIKREKPPLVKKLNNLLEERTSLENRIKEINLKLNPVRARLREIKNLEREFFDKRHRP